MQARTFFSVLNQGMRFDILQRNVMLSELVNVACCTRADPEWIDNLKSYFTDRIGNYFDDGFPRPIIKTTPEHQDLIAKSIFELIHLKKKVDGNG
jgi:hypothetical protein